MPRCEGRLIPLGLFNDIDTLESMVAHGHPSPYGHSSPPWLAEWAGVILEFGRYYGLAGAGPIAVELEYWRAAAARLGVAPDDEPDSAHGA